MKRTIISSVSAFSGYSDRGLPSIIVSVETACGAMGIVTRSMDYHLGEARERDKREILSTTTAVIEKIAPTLVGMDSARTRECDDMIVAHANGISRVATAAVSAAILKAGANALGVPLFAHIGGVGAFTMPVISVLAATGSSRYGAPINDGYNPCYSFVAYDFKHFGEAAYALWDVWSNWIKYLKDKLRIKLSAPAGMSIPPGRIDDDYSLWEMMADNIKSSGYSGKIGLQADVDAGAFYNREASVYEGLFCKKTKSRDDMIKLARSMSEDYGFVVIEDPLESDDFDGFATICKETDIQIVGDKLFANDTNRLKRGAQTGAANAILLNVGQYPTVSAAADAAALAQSLRYGVMPFSSVGEGYEVCDFAVGLNCTSVKECGISILGDHMSEIASYIGSRVRYAGKEGLKGARFRRQ
jgi:enolase